MTRGVYLAWLWILGVALGLCALVATLGTVLRLEGPTTVDCTDVDGPISGHVRLEGCVVDATDAVLVDPDTGLTAVWVAPPNGSGPPVAWVYSTADAHVRWARARRLDSAERRRYQDRHRDELETEATLQGWLGARAFPGDGPARRVQPTPHLSFERPLEPLSVGGALASGLLFFLIVGLVRRRRRWLRAQRRWAHANGHGVPGDESPTAF